MCLTDELASSVCTFLTKKLYILHVTEYISQVANSVINPQICFTYVLGNLPHSSIYFYTEEVPSRGSRRASWRRKQLPGTHYSYWGCCSLSAPLTPCFSKDRLTVPQPLPCSKRPTKGWHTPSVCEMRRRWKKAEAKGHLCT